MAYLAHPDPQIRTSAIRQVKDIDAVGISQMLVDLLADPSSTVGSATAQAIWSRNRVKFALDCLYEEIQGAGISLSPQAASQAVNQLRNAAPSAKELAQFEEWFNEIWEAEEWEVEDRAKAQIKYQDEKSKIEEIKRKLSQEEMDEVVKTVRSMTGNREGPLSETFINVIIKNKYLKDE